MIDKLISSRARVEILKLFLFNPENSYYQRQISTLTHQPIQGVQREILKLESIGLIEKLIRGSRIYYKVNKSCPIFEDLKQILFKSVGIAEALKKDFKKAEKISFAFIYGSYAKGDENLSSDIDLFVIGSITSKELSTLISKPKRELGREINYAVFPFDEIKKRIKRKDHFLNDVMKGKKIFIIGSENELKRAIKSGQT